MKPHLTKTLDCSNSNSYIATLAGSLKEYYSGRLSVILVTADHIINFIEFRGMTICSCWWEMCLITFEQVDKDGGIQREVTQLPATSGFSSIFSSRVFTASVSPFKHSVKNWCSSSAVNPNIQHLKR